MAPKASGQVIESMGQEGRTFAVRFRAYGQRHYLTLGTAEAGWTRRKAELELANVMADVRRGIRRLPEPEHEVSAPWPEPSFHGFASEWFDAHRRELRSTTRPITGGAWRTIYCRSSPATGSRRSRSRRSIATATRRSGRVSSPPSRSTRPWDSSRRSSRLRSSTGTWSEIRPGGGVAD